MVISTVTYGTETWKLKKKLESKLMSIEKDILRRSARFSRLENIEIMLLEKINIRKFVLDYIRYKKFNWYGHV